MGDERATEERLLNELRTVEENALYTSQAHFHIGDRKGTFVRVLVIGGSVLAALGGVAPLAGAPAWLGAVSVVGGLVAALSAALGGDRNVHVHFIAANALNRVRHEARLLREVRAAALSAADLTAEVVAMSRRYTDLVEGLPPTDAAAFKAAQISIQEGRFDPDFLRGVPGAAAMSGRSDGGKALETGSTDRLLPDRAGAPKPESSR